MKQTLPTRIALALIKAYQTVLSPITGNQCRYHPTCSRYAAESYRTFGFLRGSVLTIFRICNCHPYSRRPWTDPVPERFAWRDIIGYKQCKHSQPENH